MRVSDIVQESGGALSVEHSLGSGDEQLYRALFIVLTLHDGRRIDLLPELTEALADVRPSLDRFLASVRDLGTEELGREVTRQIEGTVWLNVLPPRGAVDLNRLPRHALFIKMTSEQEHVRQSLLAIHVRVSQALRHALRETPDAPTVLDIHSMFGPKHAGRISVPLFPAQFEEFVEGRRMDAMQHSKIDFITQTDGLEPAGDVELAENLAACLRRHRIRSTFNEVKKNRIMPLDLVYGEQKKGLSVEFPRRMLVRKPAMLEDPGSAEIDHDRIEKLVGIMKPALLRRVAYYDYEI